MDITYTKQTFNIQFLIEHVGAEHVSNTKVTKDQDIHLHFVSQATLTMTEDHVVSDRKVIGQS